jgi:hypothetical protein
MRVWKALALTMLILGAVALLGAAKGWSEWKPIPWGGGIYQTNVGARLQRVVYDDGWELTMKWSKNWIPQGNPALDPDAWVGAWTTNHYKGPDGSIWYYKIVYTGPDSPLWNHFTRIQVIGSGVGCEYRFDSPMGYGYFKNQWEGY